MSVTFDFIGKVALITGSSSGIGASTAILLAKSGAQVVISGTNADKLTTVAQQCQQVSPNKSKVLQVVADVTKEDDLKKLVDSTIKAFGKLNILVNNAGASGKAFVTDQNYLDVVKQTMDTNLTSVLQLTQLCVPHLEKTKGNIINISSVAALTPSQKSSPYCMSKTAMDMFTKCMAVELGPKGIRVNSVNPGAVRTQFIQRTGFTDADAQKWWDNIGAQYPVGRAGLPEDIANAIIFLASDASSFTTGTIMLVDGGHIAANTKVIRD